MTKKITPMKAMRLKCIDCCAGQSKEVRLCTIKNCSLWQYRMGCRPETYAKKVEVAKEK